MGVAERFWVRVLLLDNIRDCTLTSLSPFSVINAQTQTAEARFEQRDGLVNISISADGIVVGGHLVSSEQVIILPDEPHIFKLNGNAYRGKLKLAINADSDSFDVVNLVPLEPYLAGVVGAEMPDYWEPMALRGSDCRCKNILPVYQEAFWQQARLGCEADSGASGFIWGSPPNQPKFGTLSIKHSG